MKHFLFIFLTLPLYGQICEQDSIMAIFYEDHGSVEVLPQDIGCVGIYVETDKYSLVQLGSLAAVEAWVQRIVDNSAIIYGLEQIKIHLKSIYIAEDEEWSDNLNNTFDLLMGFAKARKDMPDGLLKHFVTLRQIPAGIAWLNQLCRDYRTFPDGDGGLWHVGPFAVSAGLKTDFPDYPEYSWTVDVFTHETGHSFGSPHTHACRWGPDGDLAIDDCRAHEGTCGTIDPPQPETIMSYCHLTPIGKDFTKGFGELPGNLIRAAVLNAGCMLECDCPDRLVLGGDIEGSYKADTIQLVGVNTIGELTLNAKIVEISNSLLNPNLVVFNEGCEN